MTLTSAIKRNILRVKTSVPKDVILNPLGGPHRLVSGDSLAEVIDNNNFNDVKQCHKRQNFRQ